MSEEMSVIWLHIHHGQLALNNGDYRHAKQPHNAAVFLSIGCLDGDEWRLALLDEAGAEQAFVGLRSLLGQVTDNEFALLSRASQLEHWWQHHQFCGRCASKTLFNADEMALECNSCGAFFYPRISPCIIVLITRGEQCLLAKHRRSKGQRYSCLAGFIEVGESAEATLMREVMEEVGLSVANIRYVTSQNWPFPSQLMLGFLADYSAGDIVVDGKEIEDATWFDASCLPELPPKGTISRFLIDDFLAQKS